MLFTGSFTRRKQIRKRKISLSIASTHVNFALNVLRIRCFHICFRSTQMNLELDPSIFEYFIAFSAEREWGESVAWRYPRLHQSVQSRTHLVRCVQFTIYSHWPRPIPKPKKYTEKWMSVARSVLGFSKEWISNQRINDIHCKLSGKVLGFC